MNNKEFIAELSRRAGFTGVATQKMVTTMIDEMKSSFEAGDTVSIANFGSFELKKRQERVVINPSTQQRMLVPPKLILSFRPMAAIKDKLKNKEDND